MRNPDIHPITEIILGLVPVLTIMWVTPLVYKDRAALQQVNFYLSILCFAVAFTSNVSHRDSLKEMGFRLDNVFSALRVLLLPTAIMALVILAIGLLCDSLNLGARFFFHLKTLPPWALAQQYALQSFIHRRLQDVWGKGEKTMQLVALIFSLLHLPNPVLAATTFIGGYIWAWAFERQPNLFALAVSHTLLSALLANSLPISILPTMKVGLGYFY